MTPSLRFLLIVFLPPLAACAHDSSVGSEVDAASPIDAPQSSSCATGSERLRITGAYAIDTSSAATVTRESTVIGLNGLHANKTYVLTVRNALTQDLGAVGSYDVATTNLKHLEIPPGADCDTAPAGTCKGFFALAGTFIVESVQPRYRATFTLTDLREHSTHGDAPGAQIAGTATGCLDVAAP